MNANGSNIPILYDRFYSVHRSRYTACVHPEMDLKMRRKRGKNQWKIFNGKKGVGRYTDFVIIIKCICK